MGYSGNLYAQASEVITSQGDLRRGDSSGNPERLAIGSTGKFLKSNGTTESWETITTADSTLTTQGDILVEGASGLERLGQSTSNYTLATKGASANPAWQASPTSVLAAAGDILYASGANTLAKLAKASDGDTLQLASGVPAWVTVAGGGGKVTLVDSQKLTSANRNITSTFTEVPSSDMSYILAVFSGESEGGNVRMDINNLAGTAYACQGPSYAGGSAYITNFTGGAFLPVCEDFLGADCFAVIKIQANPVTEQIQGFINAGGQSGWSSFSFWESTAGETGVNEIDIFEMAGNELSINTRLDVYKVEI